MTPGLSVEQTNAILNRQSQEQPNQNPFKGRTLVRSRGNHSARPVQVQNEPEPVTYANISVQYDYLNPGTSNGCDEKKSNDIPKGKIFLITGLLQSFQTPKMCHLWLISLCEKKLHYI